MYGFMGLVGGVSEESPRDSSSYFLHSSKLSSSVFINQFNSRYNNLIFKLPSFIIIQSKFIYIIIISQPSGYPLPSPSSTFAILHLFCDDVVSEMGVRIGVGVVDAMDDGVIGFVGY